MQNVTEQFNWIFDNTASYQDSCQFALEQLIIFTKQSNEVAFWISLLVIGLLTITGLMMWKLHKIEQRISGGVREKEP